MTRVAIVVSVPAVVAVAAATAITVRAGRLEVEVERWASGNAHTLSGTRDIVMLKRYAEHFGDALRIVWVAATQRAAGGIEQAFTSPTRRETRLYLNKLIPENRFVWEERPLESAVDAAKLYLYRPDGTPVTNHTTAVVFLSPFAVHYPTVIHLAAEGR